MSPKRREEDDEQGPSAAASSDWKETRSARTAERQDRQHAVAWDLRRPRVSPSTTTRIGCDAVVEPKAAYYPRVFNEYAAAKRAVGESFSVPEERFTQRLKGNEPRWPRSTASLVRFVLQNQAVQVSCSRCAEVTGSVWVDSHEVSRG